MKGFLAILLFVIATVIFTCRVVLNIQFNQNCAGYLKQAADANTVELALDRLNLAVKYIEDHNLTDGYTSVLWRTENENVGYWYTNIKACVSELEQGINGSQLEKANLLMKVRETLTDNGESGTELTIPKGISVYPNNLLWGLLMWIGVFIYVGFITYGCLIANDY